MNPRVAIIHDFFHTFGGAERVTLALSEIFPDAPIYTLTYSKKLDPWFGGKKIGPSYLQRYSWLPAKFLIPFYAKAIESFDFNDYDIVISSSHSFAKNILTNPSTIHISYIHSPMRYIWDAWHSYLKSQQLFWPINGWITNILHHLRIWDRLGVSRVDHYVANSKYVTDRIRKFYRRDSQVIYPPVDVDKIQVSPSKQDYFITLARLSQYKRVDLAIQACNELKLPLVVIGTGELEAKLKQIAGPTVKITGWIDDEQKIKYIQDCRALIFPVEEDFGIAPVEVMAAGKPVIAFRKGGCLETIIEGKTGMFFNEQTVASLVSTLQNFISQEASFDPVQISQHAQQFSRQRFQEEIKTLVNSLYAKVS